MQEGLARSPDGDGHVAPQASTPRSHPRVKNGDAPRTISPSCSASTSSSKREPVALDKSWRATWRAWTESGPPIRRTRLRTCRAPLFVTRTEGAGAEPSGSTSIRRSLRVLHRQDPRGASWGVAGVDQQVGRVVGTIVDRLSAPRRRSLPGPAHRSVGVSQVPIPRPRACGCTSAQALRSLGRNPQPMRRDPSQMPTESTAGLDAWEPEVGGQVLAFPHRISDVVQLAGVGERD